MKGIGFPLRGIGECLCVCVLCETLLWTVVPNTYGGARTAQAEILQILQILSFKYFFAVVCLL